MTRSLTSIAVFVIVLLAGQAAWAQSLSLTVTPPSFTYPTADPDVAPTVSSPAITVSYRVRFNGGANWHLSMRADHDLTSGLSTIPTTNTSWTTTIGAGLPGTLTNTDQTLDSGVGNINPLRTGTITFTLQNLWMYTAGTYTHSIVFTLSVP